METKKKKLGRPKQPQRHKGHYCRICGEHKANEKFSGKGYAAHICKVCAGRGNKPPETAPEPLVFIERDDLDEYGLLPVEDVDLLPFSGDGETPKPKKRKRKSNKAKLLRSAQKKKAKALLSETLAGGEVSVQTIEREATKAGIPREALRRAKGSLKISSAPSKGGSVWRLPARESKPEASPQSCPAL
jgi:hypothetical protein